MVITELNIEEILTAINEELQDIEPNSEMLDMTSDELKWFLRGVTSGRQDMKVAAINALYRLSAEGIAES